MTSNIRHSYLLCPGQGAQHVGMGKAWFDRYPIAAQTFAAADTALGFSLSGLCFNGPEEKLNRTDMAQVAIYVASVACYQALLEDNKIGEVAGAAGLSLGEFTALHLAGAFDFADGLELVRLRGEAMQQAAEAAESSMVAITGEVTEEKINELCAKALATLPTPVSEESATKSGILVPANFNSPMQVVVSGDVTSCRRAIEIAGEMGFKPTPLSVAGAFHSPIMQPAADRLKAALDKVEWSEPRVPVISNVTATEHPNDTERIKARLVEQLTHPVRWSQSMAHAVGAYPAARFIELAPGKVLVGLMRRIHRDTKVENFAVPA